MEIIHFCFFDDFEGASLDGTKWDTAIRGGRVTVANSIVAVRSTARDKNNAEIISKQGFKFGNIMETYAKVTQGSNDYHEIGRASNFSTRRYGQKSPSENYIFQYIYSYYNPDLQRFYSSKESSSTYTDTSVLLGTWNTIGMFSNGTSAEYWRDGSLIVKATDSNYCPDADTTGQIFMLAFSYCTNVVIEADWVRVRKYISPEPSATIGVVEEEQ